VGREVPKEWKLLYEWLKANSEEVAEELTDGFFILMALVSGSEIGTIIMADDIVRKVFEIVPREVLPKPKGKR